MTRPLAALCLLLLSAAPLRAHPIPRGEYDRNCTVEFTPTAVKLLYRLEIDQFTLVNSINALGDKADRAKLRTPDDFAKLYEARLLKAVPDGLIATLDGRPVAWKVEKSKREIRDAVGFHLFLSIPLAPGPKPLAFTVEETNFPDKKGRFKIAVEPHADTDLADVLGEEDRRIDNPQSQSPKPFSALISWPNYVADAPKPAPEAVTSETISEASPAELSTFERIRTQGLAGLFSSTGGFWILFAMAWLFGMGHALTPGHGKTLVAAYLVGERGGFIHAFALGAIVTVSHTGIVILIALGLTAFGPDHLSPAIQKNLGLIGGGIIILIGVWLLWRRLAGRADHVHLFGGHEGCGGASPVGPVCVDPRRLKPAAGSCSTVHGTGLVNLPKPKLGRSGWTRLILLGISGGIVPCSDALMLLIFAISTSQLWLGVKLLIAFSAGVAAVLVALGIAVVYARRVTRGGWSESRLFKAIPVFSSLLVLAMGLWLCLENLPN